VSAVRYELGYYIPEDSILHSHHHKYHKSYMFQIKVCSVVLDLYFMLHCNLSYGESFMSYYSVPLSTSCKSGVTVHAWGHTVA
jgi:hypothetical protein